jgi:predicted DCC family thiol-disulfide oxidoreductase YuxK
MGAGAVVIYDELCSFCRTTQRIIASLDWLRSLEWVPLQSPRAERFGIPRESLEKSIYLVAQSGRWSGFAACKKILLRLPVLYILIAASAFLTPWLLVAWLLFFLPPAAPVGERVYDWVARNRFRLPGSSCKRELE